MRERDDRDAADVDRKVEDEIIHADKRLEHLAVVLLGERRLVEGDTVLGGFLAAASVRGHDRDPVGRDAQMAQDQWQDSLTDAPASQHDETARKLGVNDILGHRGPLLLTKATLYQTTGRDRLVPPGSLGHSGRWPGTRPS